MPSLVSSGAAVMALECARAVGLDPAHLAQQVGLRMSDLSDPDAGLPLAKFVRHARVWGEVHCPLTPETRGMLGLEELRR